MASRNGFQPGNKCGRGNPFLGKINDLRKSLYATFTPKEAKEVWKKLIEMAKNGDKGAIEMLCNFAGMRWKDAELEAMALDADENKASIMELLNANSTS